MQRHADTEPIIVCSRQIKLSAELSRASSASLQTMATHLNIGERSADRAAMSCGGLKRFRAMPALRVRHEPIRSRGKLFRTTRPFIDDSAYVI